MQLIERIYCRLFQLGFRLALPALPYRYPTLLDGLESIPSVLSSHGVERVLLVVDGAVRRLGLTSRFETLLSNSGFEFSVYEQTRPNPTVDNVEEARALYLSSNAGGIVAIGGGSALDCAKVVGARVVKPRQRVSEMRGILKILRSTPLTIAVPTTAGTGSEATLAAVVTEPSTKHKYPINDFALIPNYAVLAPELTVGLPPFITSTTGMDALTHAVEAYIGGTTTRSTRALCVEATRLIRAHLVDATREGSNLSHRSGMLRAAYCAGCAFTRSYVGYVHGLAHSLGGQYGIAHGLANAVILPRFLELYGERIERKLGELSRLSGISSSASDSVASSSFIDWVYSLNREFGLPAGFSEILESDIPSMARHAAKECNPLYPVPKLMDARELEAVLRSLMV